MYSAYGAAPQSLPTHYLAAGDPRKAYEQIPLTAGRKGGAFASQRRSWSAFHVVQAFFLPWIVFIVMVAIHGFWIHYSSISGATILDILVFAIVVFQATLAWAAFRRRQEIGMQEPAWLVFISAACLVAWILGLVAGQHIFVDYSRPYYDIAGLNVYTDVDPAVSRGQMLMDAGRVMFKTGSHLEVSKSMGFRNVDTYCVAPVVNAANASGHSTYDFWAIGTNCCSAHGGDFHCGAYASTRATSGLRVMETSGSDRQFYRLAVQQAEAAYNIRSGHPIFFHWVEDPAKQVANMMDEGVRQFTLFIFAWLAWQVFATVLAVLAIAKL